MNLQKYSERVRGFLQNAQTYALGEGNPQFTAEHVLKALLDDEEGMAASLISRAGGDPRIAKNANDEAIKKLPKTSGGNGQLSLAQPLARIFNAAEEAAIMGSPKSSSHGRRLFGLIKGDDDGPVAADGKRLSKDNRTLLQETLFDLLECKRLLDQVR